MSVLYLCLIIHDISFHNNVGLIRYECTNPTEVTTEAKSASGRVWGYECLTSASASMKTTHNPRPTSKDFHFVGLTSAADCLPSDFLIEV